MLLLVDPRIAVQGNRYGEGLPFIHEVYLLHHTRYEALVNDFTSADAFTDFTSNFGIREISSEFRTGEVDDTAARGRAIPRGDFAKRNLVIIEEVSHVRPAIHDPDSQFDSACHDRILAWPAHWTLDAR